MSDTPMHRRLFVEMNAEEQQQFIDGIQQRRLATVQRYKDAMALKQQVKDAKLAADMEKTCTKLTRDMERYDKLHDAIMASIGKITALSTLAKAGV